MTHPDFTSASSWTATGAGPPGGNSRACMATEAGVEAIRRVVEAAPHQDVGTLTLYAFSSDNWRRPKAEVTALMALLRSYLADEIESLVRNDVRLTVIGRRDRLPFGLADAIADAEAATAPGDVLHLRIAIDYSARDAILNAAAQVAGLDNLTRASFAAARHRRARTSRRRSRDPHQRREASVRFPAVGKRLRRAAFHRTHVARFRSRRPRRSAAIFSRTRTPVRRPATAQSRTGGRRLARVGRISCELPGGCPFGPNRER